ncbi:MAG: AraC family transcriptional regulator [Cyclobacteriaceae bacterium]|nr:AraC family transcriptional regulator [Cyclobacteriaceae bacterium HetDA_MAG_MS6]
MIKAFNIFNLLVAFGAFQALFLAAVTLIKTKSLPKILFSFFLIIEGFTFVERLLAETNLMVQFPHILGISYPLNFIKPPILFLLALSITKPVFKMRIRHLWHTIPFLLMLLLNFPFYALSAEEKVYQVTAFINYVPAYNSFNFWFFLSFFLYIGGYLIVSLKVLNNYRNHVKNNKLANWYRWVLYLYVGLLVIYLLYYVVRPTGQFEFPMVNTANMLLMTFLIQSIAYSFLSDSPVLIHRNPVPWNSEEEVSRYGPLLKDKFEKDKVFLDDSLSLEKLAKALGLPVKRTSNMINQKYGCSFKEVVNQYRVENAKTLMNGSAGKKLSVTYIGLKSGFNNKVSFYRTFKKYTGKSPSEYFRERSK